MTGRRCGGARRYRVVPVQDFRPYDRLQSQILNPDPYPSFVRFGTQPIVVEGFVGTDGVEVHVLDQRLDANAVVTLARQKHEARQLDEDSIHRHHHS